MNRKICVLMSTYNGEKYLRVQLDSILLQENVEVNVLIRDDGSNDSTLSIIREYSLKKNVNYYDDGRNLGPCNSFIDLLWHVELNYDYYALSDQDDYWLSDKLSTGIDCLNNNSGCQIYSSYYTMVDDNLSKIPNRIDDKRHEPTLGNSVIENQVTGCTVIMTKEFLEKIRSFKRPENQYIHDWWLYRLGTLWNALYIEKTSKILYRQHGNNTIGLDGGFIQRIVRVIRNSSKMKKALIAQNKEFAEIYPLSENEKKLFDLINYKRKIIGLLVNRDIERNSIIETLFYKLWMMTW